MSLNSHLVLQDLEEGSADWGDFYYDEYNYGGEEVDSTFGDTEEGDDAYEDITSPPPYLDLGDGRRRKEEADLWSKHNFRKEQDDFNDFEIVEEDKVDSRDRGSGRTRAEGSEGRRTGGCSVLAPPPLFLLLLLLAFPFLSFPSPGS